ncbi:precorrin-6y C5,15-methyltransferase (decarboxylating) subunit CbiE [Bosea sp. (in: a-proteobacteria)]|uniref:precorrin-6y C5,15-methyltransferase (decarboxylating) subunit CbiE n=1 Tax=Bosea sp. (in: a-proteobacteria) TaxID=1871050 RepID=UPI002FCB42AA
MNQFSPETRELSSTGPVGPWLSLVGLGEDGRAGLCDAARAALEQAEVVFGGERHLALIGAVPGEARAWPQPFRNALPAILAERGRPVCVLATSDPFHYGIGAGLTKAVAPEEMRVIPQLSAFSMACTRMRWPQEECALVSLHGRALQRIIPLLQPGARVLALSWDESTPAAVARLLSERGLGASSVTVLEALGGPKERIREARAEDFALDGIVPLNMLAVSVVAGTDARILPLANGIPDEWFEHDGQLTKADIRAITLSALAPRAGELLWDIGAGAGSIGIEWCLRHRHNRAVAFEERPERAARLARNRLALGAPPIEIVEGKAPESFAGKATPDAVFIGGGLTDPGLFEAAFAALKPRGRLIANAVTIEGEARLAGLFAQHGGNLRRIGVAHLDPIGNMHGWRSAMAVTQWRVVKP